MLLFAAIIIVFLIFSIRYPDFMFWLAVTILLDPGGYVQTYFTRSAIGGLQLWDLQFVLLMIPLISPKIKVSFFFKFKDNCWMFFFLFFYALVYHVFVYGYLMTDASLSSLLAFLQYERLTIVGFVAILPAYIFFRRSYRRLVKFALVTSIAVASFFLIRIFTQLPIIPVVQYSREFSGAMRIILVSYGFAYWFIGVSVVIMLYNIRVAHKSAIYFIGISIVFAIILTLTRRSVISLMFFVFVIYFIRQRFHNKFLLSGKLNKVFISLLTVLLFVFLVTPQYIGYTIQGLESVVVLAATGEYEGGMEDDRLAHDIPQHLARFKSSPILGYGYDATWYSNNAEEGGISANDVPLTAALGMYGILGLVIYLFFYFKLFKIMYKTYRILKVGYFSGITHKYPVLFVICLTLLVSLISRFTINFMGYFSDLIQGVPRVIFMLFIGFFLASRDMIYSVLQKNKKSIPNFQHE
ncbi:MAG: hypothetical protein K9J25_06620 [Bacteroidales bacterium]|nr:hypothetical protein [Bacteroidales bacterium]